MFHIVVCKSSGHTLETYLGKLLSVNHHIFTGNEQTGKYIFGEEKVACNNAEVFQRHQCTIAGRHRIMQQMYCYSTSEVLGYGYHGKIYSI